jgi:hypothetical protein
VATLYVAEYPDINPYLGSITPIVAEPPLAEQTVAIGAGSVQSSAFADRTRVIRVHADAVCSILVGPNPTATAAKKRFAAGQTEYFRVTGGDKIAVIQNT